MDLDRGALLDAEVWEKILALRTPDNLDAVLANISVGRKRGMDGFFTVSGLKIVSWTRCT